MQVSLTSRGRLPRFDLWMVIAALGSAAITGCGSTSASHASRVPISSFQFARCMRAHGAPSFPDPGPNGIQISPGSQPPAFEAALNSCQKYLPPSRHPPPIPESMRLQMIAFANCMRAHGVPNFPDPGPNGIQFPVNSPITQSPAFQRAQNGPCKKYLSH